jgi:transposase
MAQLRRENQELKAKNERCAPDLEEALRASKRQAAPFSRRHPKTQPQKPGRKSGQKYGRRCRRPVPKQVDEVVEEPLPSRCPRCGGGLEEEEETVSQFQTEIPPPQVERIEFRIQVGRCWCCRRRVQGRRPRQTSKAIGGAASRLGPRALALGTPLNIRGLRLPYGNTATVLEQAFGLRVSRGGLARREALQNQTRTTETA